VYIGIPGDRMLNQVRIIALVIVFVAVFTLFYIFDNLQKISTNCQREKSDLCNQLSGVSIPVLVVLLMVGGLSLIICVVSYITLTFK
jgi:hypothetical protein